MSREAIDEMLRGVKRHADRVGKSLTERELRREVVDPIRQLEREERHHGDRDYREGERKNKLR